MESVEIGARFQYRTWDRPVNNRVLYLAKHTEAVLFPYILAELQGLSSGYFPMIYPYYGWCSRRDSNPGHQGESLACEALSRKIGKDWPNYTTEAVFNGIFYYLCDS